MGLRALVDVSAVSLLDCVSVVFLVAAVCSYAIFRLSLKNLKDGSAVKKSERLAVTLAVCFLWPSIVLFLLRITHQGLGTAAALTSLVVLFYLCQDVKALVPYVGLVNEYQGGETLVERSTQISTAAFATGTILLSAGKEVASRVAPFVFLALLLCVVSAVPSAPSQKGGGEKHASWDSFQKSGMSIAAGLLALAIGICVDAQLSPSWALAGGGRRDAGL